MKTSCRVIVTDDDPLARRSVKDVLRAHGLTVIAEAADGREGAELALHYRPDVVLMDVVMPVMSGLEATERIVSAAPGVKVVLLTASADEEVALIGLRSGAVGFLSKTVDLEALPRVVEAVAAGEAAVSRELTARLIDRLRSSRGTTAGMRPVRSVLSDREWEVLDLLCLDATTDEIAERLVLSKETVRSHVKSILRKLGVPSRAEAVEAAGRLREQTPAG